MDLVGRRDVMRSCLAALRAACDGRGSVVLLAGEAGIGKTSVGRAIAEAAEKEGAVVRWAGCWEGGSVPFGLWADALRQPGGGACGQVASALADLDMEVGHEVTALQRARARLAAKLIDALRVDAAERPQVVILDDLHWADASSIDVLCAVAGQVSTTRVLVVGTYRDDEVAVGSALRSVSGAVDRIHLGGLASDDIAAVLAETLERAPTPEEVADVAQRSGGNPLFATHLGRMLAAGASLGVPTGLRDLLGRRLARLPSASHEVLGAAAVLGTEFDAFVVAEMLHQPDSETLAALDDAASARIAAPVAELAGRWAFTHALLRDARYDALASAERMTLHRRACETLDATGRVPARVLAAHAAHADFDAADLRPARLALAAGDEARARLAVDEAIELYEAALARAPADAAELRAEAQLGLGDARLRMGDATGAAEVFEGVARTAREAGDTSLLARAALGLGAGLSGFEVRMLDRRQTALLEEAAAAVEATSPLRPWVLARLSVAVSFVESESRRLGLADEALRLARQLDDPAAVAAALASRCDALAGPSFAAERAGIASEITAIGLRLGQRNVELLGRRMRVAALAELCDIDGMDAEIAAYERSAAALGDPFYSWYAPLWRAMRALTRGQIAQAEWLRDEARRLGAEAGSVNATVLTAVLDLFIGLGTGDPTAFRARFDALSAEFPELLLANGSPMLAYTDCLLDAPGWEDRARRVIAEVDGLTIDAEWLCTIAPLTDLVLRLDLAEEADGLYRLFAPFAGMGVVEGIVAAHRGPTDRYLMALAALAGDEPATVEHLERALTIAARVGPLVLADTEEAASAVLRRLDGAGHTARAEALERKAAATFEAVGLSARARPPSTGPPARALVRDRSPAGSLVREGDTWAVTWGGATVRIRHAKGIADLSLLLARPAQEVHVRELDGAAVAGRPGRQDVLDQAAVDHYRTRLRELDEDLDEADRHHDTERAARLTAERDALVEELTAAFGIDGRPRSLGSDLDERLRKAVASRIKATIDRIAQLQPDLGRHLRVSVRTGTWCAYTPERDVSWHIER